PRVLPDRPNLPLRGRLDVGFDSVARGGQGGLKADRPIPKLQAAHGMVREIPQGPDRCQRFDDDAGTGRAHHVLSRQATTAQAGARPYGGRKRVSLALRNPFGIAVPPRPPVRASLRGSRTPAPRSTRSTPG